MCGRYTLRSVSQLVSDYAAGLTAPFVDFVPRYNVAPTQQMPILRRVKSGGFELVPMKWGLVPSWAKEAKIGNSLINARAETVAEKPAFRTAFLRRRCLVPVDGFYEWRHRPDETKKAGPKTPHFIHLKSDEAFTFAGLWERWHNPADENAPPLETYTILTTSPNELMSSLHDRMPVILDRDAAQRWMDGSMGPAELKQLLVPYPSEPMDAYVVDRAVNSPRNESAGLITPIGK